MSSQLLIPALLVRIQIIKKPRKNGEIRGNANTKARGSDKSLVNSVQIKECSVR